MRQWTFVTNHAVVLSFVAHHPSITARDLSLEIGITERAVRRIIAELEAGGYIAKKKEGRRVRYRIKPDVPLRHSSHRDKAVGDLLGVLSWRDKKTGKEGIRKT
jgi:DNA-binding transcriptional ArsR family regulator